MRENIWIVEDDSDDRSLVRETLSELKLDLPVTFLASSTGLFESLSALPKPALLLVDYNSAPDNGLEVLKKLKRHEEYSSIPVVILSDNDLPLYKEECYRYGASSFIKKPSTVEGTLKKIGTFFNYWMEVAEV